MGLIIVHQKNRKEFSDPGRSPSIAEGNDDAKGENVASGEELPYDCHSISSSSDINCMGHAQHVTESGGKSYRSQNIERINSNKKDEGQKVSCKNDTESGQCDNTVIGEDEDVFRDEILYSNNKISFDLPKPCSVSLQSSVLKGYDHMQVKFQHAYPTIFRWIKHFGKIMLLLFFVLSEWTVRGFESFMHMGTTSFFSIFWCSSASIIAMSGIFKFLIFLAVAPAAGLLLGFLPAVVSVGIAGITFLWIYGSFWTTGFIIFLGGLSFIFSFHRVALSITSVYAIYCAWSYVGWLGLVLSLNLSFISSDALLFFLRAVTSEGRTPGSSLEHDAGVKDQLNNEVSTHASTSEDGAAGLHADRSPGVPSTSEYDSETTKDEVARLLNDHYGAMDSSRFDKIDASGVRGEYLKKSMLVPPGKNVSDEKSAEAVQKLQKSYEILLGSLKLKEYDDELKREELLNYFRRFQNLLQETQGQSLMASSFGHSEVDDKDLFGLFRKIACKKCGFFHVWVLSKKVKSRARWCQECKDCHPAEDGDGWVEQSSKPLFFGLLQKVDTLSAFVCAKDKVYEATEWYLCKGLKCAANTHKPTFRMNANAIQENSQAKVKVRD